MDANNYAEIGLVFFLFGIFCAYWAQTTKRNAWLWFFLGWFFAPLTGLVLLNKNSRDGISALNQPKQAELETKSERKEFESRFAYQLGRFIRKMFGGQ